MSGFLCQRIGNSRRRRTRTARNAVCLESAHHGRSFLDDVAKHIRHLSFTLGHLSIPIVDEHCHLELACCLASIRIRIIRAPTRLVYLVPHSTFDCCRCSPLSDIAGVLLF